MTGRKSKKILVSWLDSYDFLIKKRAIFGQKRALKRKTPMF